ncbi:von Willebrand factor A domain-containing protein 7-like [Haliotis rubra]|uniref:von Willebrand factor A domain-containing protein 7-like n=1 Tax=Haliotis rubra TaxID=36100 RepID=UPI001EE51AC6|nr:von Willebrand factor A domain-containing protein 7-like [Haliotis rubra]
MSTPRSLLGEKGVYALRADTRRLSSVDIGDGTWTHADITEMGILKAVAAYFEANPRPNTTLAAGDLTQMKNMTTRKLFQAYYGEGVPESRFRDAINSIIKANNQVNLDLFRTAAWHCNGETIREANKKMISLRERAIEVLSQSSTNFDLARTLIGQYLHIMQMFYSNTNWIELSGGVMYHSLGIRNKTLLGEALPEMDTCISSSEAVNATCDGNMILDDKILTSGYRSGQDVIKPYKDPSVSTTGKCSHGGPWDESSSSVAALGGINKDSFLVSLSPHSHLHLVAAQAAIEHTSYFFDDEEYGIRGIIGTNKFNDLLQLTSGPSLAFIIDYSGSMGDDLEGIKSVIRDIMSSKIGTLEEPANFIFSLFNDPLSKSTTYRTNDGNNALSYLEGISVSGGGDCPEYAMDGLFNGLALCNYNSDLYFFTDASAKFPEVLSSVQSLATQKNVRLQMFLTDDLCGSSTALDYYRKLATYTGGSVFITSKDGIARVASILKEFSSPSVTIVKATVTPDMMVAFPLDRTVLQATLKITTEDRATPVYKLYKPNDIEATSNVKDFGDGIHVVKIQTPTTGVWRLARLGSTTWDVEVTAQSTLDVSTTFVKLDPISGFEYEISGRPIAGENATVILGIPSSDDVRTVDNVILTDPQGAELARHGGLIQVASRADSLTYRTTFSLPVEAFQMAVEGTDKGGNKFLRLQTRVIVPVGIDLAFLPNNGSTYTIGENTIPFTVVNKAEAESNITVRLSHRVTSSEYHYTLQPGERKSASETLDVTDYDVRTFTLTAKTSSASESEFQYDIIHLVAEKPDLREEDDTIPVCNVTSVTGSCDVTMLDPCVCSQYKWSGTAEIRDNGFGLYQVTASINATGSFRHDNFTLGYNGTISATITSDCCYPLVFITVVDIASNTGQCVFDLSPGLTKPIRSCNSTTQCQLPPPGAAATTSPGRAADATSPGRDADATSSPGPSADATSSPGPSAAATSSPGPSAAATTSPGPSAAATSSPGPGAAATTSPGPGTSTVPAPPIPSYLGKDLEAVVGVAAFGGILVLVLLIAIVVICCKSGAGRRKYKRRKYAERRY